MELIKSSLLLAIFCSSLVLVVSFGESGTPSLLKTNLQKLLPEATTKEIRNNFKVFLTNAKIRQVPLAKKRSELLLSKLYKEERVLKEQIQNLERNLGMVGNNMKRQGLRVIEVSDHKKEEDVKGQTRKPKIKVSDLTSSRIDEWKAELEAKKAEFAELRSKIEESKNIIKNPENYISIPTNYGRRDVEDVREAEREILINDRENMDFRLKIATRQDVPAWITDSW